MERRGRMRRLYLVILFIFIVVHPAWGQNLEIREIRVEAQQVILWDIEKAEELVVRPGDVIEGWTLVKITENDLTVSYLGEDNVIYTTDLPLRSRIRVHRPPP
jgi:hypothetical protein